MGKQSGQGVLAVARRVTSTLRTTTTGSTRFKPGDQVRLRVAGPLNNADYFVRQYFSKGEVGKVMGQATKKGCVVVHFFGENWVVKAAKLTLLKRKRA